MPNYIYYILLVIGFIITIIGFKLIISSVGYRSNLRTLFGACLFYIGIVLFFSIPRLKKILNEFDKHQQLEHVKTYYLDGREVDPNTIDIDLYEFTIKDDVCYLTGK